MIGPFLTQSATRTRRIVNALGKIASEDESTFPCRHERRFERVAGVQGERMVERHLIYAASGADVMVGDRITVAGVSGSGGVPDEWAVQSVFPARGFGPSHLEISV